MKMKKTYYLMIPKEIEETFSLNRITLDHHEVSDDFQQHILEVLMTNKFLGVDLSELSTAPNGFYFFDVMYRKMTGKRVFSHSVSKELKLCNDATIELIDDNHYHKKINNNRFLFMCLIDFLYTKQFYTLSYIEELFEQENGSIFDRNVFSENYNHLIQIDSSESEVFFSS